MAVVADADGSQVTYAELDADADRWAHLLRRAGAAPGVAVGVLAHRLVELVTGALAVLKAGAVYLPLDPDLPDARLEFLVSDSGAPAVLVAGRSGPPAAPTTRWLPLEHRPAVEPGTGPVPLAGPGDPAYLI